MSDGAVARLHVVLVEPEIPQNTGNVARTCAAVGAVLHLVHPLGFDVSERAVKRAGLDYWHLLELHEHDSTDAFLSEHQNDELFFFSTRGEKPHSSVQYGGHGPMRHDCYLLFGRETQGLPEELLDEHRDRVLRIPIRHETRSLNLSNAVAVAVYEVLRQWGYPQLRVGK